MTEFVSEKVVPPFLRWTGSKRWFTKDFISDFLPEKFNNYHEPFLGGGAVFFHLKSTCLDTNRRFFISDSNSELINCYVKLKEDVCKVVYYLAKYRNTEEEYYHIRASRPRNSFKQAARFIYLNRTSFNGIYRVNSNGDYNVPFGKRFNADVITADLLAAVSLLLQDTYIETCNFDSTLRNIRENDLVFIDPPYTVAHENNGFIEYNQTLFSWSDQLRLKEFVSEVRGRNAFFILTNASHQSLLDLYGELASVQKLSRLSKVGGRNKTRGNFNELVIFNTK